MRREEPKEEKKKKSIIDGNRWHLKNPELKKLNLFSNAPKTSKKVLATPVDGPDIAAALACLPAVMDLKISSRENSKTKTKTKVPLPPRPGALAAAAGLRALSTAAATLKAADAVLASLDAADAAASAVTDALERGKRAISHGRALGADACRDAELERKTIATVERKKRLVASFLEAYQLSASEAAALEAGPEASVEEGGGAADSAPSSSGGGAPGTAAAASEKQQRQRQKQQQQEKQTRAFFAALRRVEAIRGNAEALARRGGGGGSGEQGGGTGGGGTFSRAGLQLADEMRATQDAALERVAR
jgi:hypothetical protein